MVDDKILMKVNGIEVFRYSLEAFINSGCVSGFVVVYRDEAQKDALMALCKDVSLPLFWVQGGVERQHSVFNGVKGLPEEFEYVMIHDCARPLITIQNIRELYDAVVEDKAAVLAHRVTNTVKCVKDTGKGSRCCYAEDVDRSSLWATETPQAFERKLILDAYNNVHTNNLRITDDVSAASLAGHSITFVENNTPNPKLTTPSYLKYIEFLLR